jgi:hypothetical protein
MNKKDECSLQKTIDELLDVTPENEFTFNALRVFVNKLADNHSLNLERLTPADAHRLITHVNIANKEDYPDCSGNVYEYCRYELKRILNECIALCDQRKCFKLPLL